MNNDPNQNQNANQTPGQEGQQPATENSAGAAPASTENQKEKVTLTITGAAFKGRKDIPDVEVGSRLETVLKNAGLADPAKYSFRDEKGKEVGLKSTVKGNVIVSSTDNAGQTSVPQTGSKPAARRNYSSTERTSGG